MIMAVKPADEEHPYGHGRVEALAAFVVGLILAAGGSGICWNSLQAVGARHAPSSWAAIAVLIVAIAIRAVMSADEFRVRRRIHSAAPRRPRVERHGSTSSLAGTGLTEVTLACTTAPVFCRQPLRRLRGRGHLEPEGGGRLCNPSLDSWNHAGKRLKEASHSPRDLPGFFGGKKLSPKTG